MLHQGLNFKCNFEDYIAVFDNVLWLNKHWRLCNESPEVDTSGVNEVHLCQHEMTMEL
jgi:hypothetical protein